MFLLSIARAPFLFFFVYLSVLLVPQVSDVSNSTAEYSPAGNMSSNSAQIRRKEFEVRIPK
jgi:hypothetical protein